MTLFLPSQDIGKGMNITTPDQCGTLCMAAVKCFRSTFIPPPPDGGNATTGICLVSFWLSGCTSAWLCALKGCSWQGRGNGTRAYANPSSVGCVCRGPAPSYTVPQ